MVPGANGSRMTGEERERLMLVCVRRYRAGETVTDLAAATGRPERFVEGLLMEAGVSLRRRPAHGDPDPAGPGTPVAPTRSIPAAASLSPERVEASAPATADDGQDGSRDLDRSPRPLTDWGLPTPPLRVLIKKKPKAREKALAAATARRKREAGAPDHDGTDPSFAGKKSTAGKKKAGKKSKKSGQR